MVWLHTHCSQLSFSYILTMYLGTWYTLEVVNHLEGQYALLGVTFIRYGEGESMLDFTSEEMMIEMFPGHEEAIQVISRNTQT